MNVVHADVKLENCLFANGQDIESLRLVDFGLSYKMKSVDDIPEGVRGTLNYMAPEILLSGNSGNIGLKGENAQKVDVWATGIILFVLTMGFYPFSGQSQQEIYTQMTTPEHLIHARFASYPQWQALNPLLQNLILQMIRVNP